MTRRVHEDLMAVPGFIGTGPWALSRALDAVSGGDHERWADMATLLIDGLADCQTLHDFEKFAKRETVLLRIQSVIATTSPSSKQ